MTNIRSLSPLTRRRLQAVLLAAYIIVVSGLLFARFTNAGYDDPFITYRYAQNLADGRGFVYNPGQRTLSTTTPLFTVLLALLTPLPVDMPTQAILIGCVSLALGGLLLWDLSCTWKTPAVGWAGLLLYPTFRRLVSTLGSETPLYIAFCLGAFAFFARKRYNWAAAFCALAVLTRPDGVLVPVVLAVGYLWQMRRSLSLKSLPWRAILVFLGLLAPWGLFAWLYFGSPLPVTLAAKQSQGTMTIFQSFFDGFVTILTNHARFANYWVEAALAAIGILWLVRRGRPWILLLAWTTLYFGAYLFLGVSRYFWYYGPLLPGFIALVGLGVEAIRNLGLPTGQPDERFAAGGSASRPLLVLLVLLILGQAVDLNRLSNTPDIRLGLYRVAGDWLRANTPPDATIGTLEVGILGYYSERQIIDFAGLLQPQVVSHLTGQSSFENAAIWAVKNYQPDYLLLHRGILPTLEAGYAARRCHAERSFSSDYLVLDLYACSK